MLFLSNNTQLKQILCILITKPKRSTNFSNLFLE